MTDAHLSHFRHRLPTSIRSRRGFNYLLAEDSMEVELTMDAVDVVAVKVDEVMEIPAASRKAFSKGLMTEEAEAVAE